MTDDPTFARRPELVLSPSGPIVLPGEVKNGMCTNRMGSPWGLPGWRDIVRSSFVGEIEASEVEK
jgi:hypothetical protein